MKPPIAVLYARADSIYKQFPDLDVFDRNRDARTWPGGAPCIAHPPCRAWGRLRHFANPRPDEMDLARHAIAMVRLNGGILEHPAASTLWPDRDIPQPGKRDRWRGYTIPIDQHWYGHKAKKATFLYIVGIEPASLPPIPYNMKTPAYVIQTNTKNDPRPHVSKADRERTPPDLARWLVETAERIRSN